MSHQSCPRCTCREPDELISPKALAVILLCILVVLVAGGISIDYLLGRYL